MYILKICIPCFIECFTIGVRACVRVTVVCMNIYKFQVYCTLFTADKTLHKIVYNNNIKRYR